MDEQKKLTPESRVTLREITSETLASVLKLFVHEHQRQFVASNASSLAEAHFSKHAWYRAVYADDTPVGFVMVEDKPEIPEYFLWRFMIDVRWQRLGYGRRALQQVIEHIRTRPGATVLLTSVVPAPGGPQPFYEGLGFVDTGKVEDGEKVLRLDL